MYLFHVFEPECGIERNYIQRHDSNLLERLNDKSSDLISIGVSENLIRLKISI